MNPAENLTDTKNTQKLPLGEAARWLKISDTSLRRYETSGKIKAERLDNGYRLFDVNELDKFKRQLEIDRENYRRTMAQQVTKKSQPASTKILKNFNKTEAA